MDDSTKALHESLTAQLQAIAPVWEPRIKSAIESLAYFGNPIDEALLPSFSGEEPTEPHKIETIYGFTHLHEPDAVARAFLQYAPHIQAARAFARRLPELGDSYDHLGKRFRWQHEPTATLVMHDAPIFKGGIGLCISMVILCPAIATRKAA